MQKLFAIISLAIAVIAGFKEAISKHRSESDEKDKLITDLRNKLEEEQVDDKELIDRATAAEARALDLERNSEALDVEAEKLAKVLNEEPAVPTVNPETFAVESGPTETPGQLEARDRAAETAGGVTATQNLNS